MMTKRAPMSGIIRVLKDALAFNCEFDAVILCEKQKDLSHSNRQNNRNLVRRALDKGFLDTNPLTGLCTVNAEGKNFLKSLELRDQGVVVRGVRAKTRAPRRETVRSEYRPPALQFVPSELVCRVPNSVFSIGPCSFQAPFNVNGLR